MAGSPVITCPECEKQFKAKGDVAGKKIRCPFCTHSFVASEADSLESAIKDKEKKPAKKNPTPKAGATTIALAGDDSQAEENDNPYGVKTLDLTPRCPNCANELESGDAVVCLFCGYNTMTREWGKTEKTIGVTGGRHFLHLLPGILAVLFIFWQTIGMLYYCVVMPYHVAGTWMEWTDHESMRMWTVILTMFDIWPVGYYAYKRLLVMPKPAEVKKE